MTTGEVNTAIGIYAGKSNTTGSNNTCIGYQAGTSSSPANISSDSNRIVLGNNNVTDIYCADTSISSSDERDKADITDFNLGLNVVNKLRPVTYKWDKRSWYFKNDEEDLSKVTRDGSKKKSRINLGFIAQEVLALEKENGFANSPDDTLIARADGSGTLGLKYERLVPVLVNAIQELSTKITALENA